MRTKIREFFFKQKTYSEDIFFEALLLQVANGQKQTNSCEVENIC